MRISENQLRRFVQRELLIELFGFGKIQEEATVADEEKEDEESLDEEDDNDVAAGGRIEPPQPWAY